MTADLTTTPYMLLSVPVPQVRTGPLYASDLVTLIGIIDAHDHTSLKGARIPAGGLSIQSDLDINAGGSTTGNNMIGARSLRMVQQAAVLSGSSDAGCTSNVGGNLYWNYNSSTQVQITAGGSLNTAGLLTNSWARTTVSTNISIGASDTFAYYDVTTAGGTRTITLPRANTVPGKFYTFRADSAANGIVFGIDGADTIDGGGLGVSLTLPKVAKGVWRLWSDGQTAGKWYIERSSQDLNGASVPVGGALTAGNTLQVSSGGVLAYAALNLAGGSNYVTGRLPASNVGVPGGDLGSSGSGLDTATVIAITGTGGFAYVACQAVAFATGVSAPIIGQANTAGAGQPMQLAAQFSTAATGGALTVKGGDGTTAGGVLNLGGGSDGTANENAAGNITIKRGAVSHMTITGNKSTMTMTVASPASAGAGLTLNIAGSAATTTGAGGTVAHTAGDAAGAGAQNGGGWLARSGTPSGTGLAGSMTLALKNSGSVNVLNGAEVAASRFGVALMGTANTTTIPSGSNVVAICDATTNPSSAPSGAFLIYGDQANSGVPRIYSGGNYAIAWEKLANITDAAPAGLVAGAGTTVPSRPDVYLRVIVQGGHYAIPLFAIT